MRESRTYGSGRGACDETHVPTATPAHISSQGLAARPIVVRTQQPVMPVI